jgi:type II secretory pathway pseudopilin PulG
MEQTLRRPGLIRAMTLAEMVIVVFLLGAGLFLVNGWMSRSRQMSKHDLARRMLADLDKALAKYQRTMGSFPPSYGPESAISATVSLIDSDKRIREILDKFPSSLWRGPGRRDLIDPWGTPLRYHPQNSDSPMVKANNNRPIFVSAGPDRDFGDSDLSLSGDNLRSDDPGSEGFRLHDVMRDTFAEEERERAGDNAKKDD